MDILKSFHDLVLEYKLLIAVSNQLILITHLKNKIK